jgi:hypothetical protein
MSSKGNIVHYGLHDYYRSVAPPAFCLEAIKKMNARRKSAAEE